MNGWTKKTTSFNDKNWKCCSQLRWNTDPRILLIRGWLGFWDIIVMFVLQCLSNVKLLMLFSWIFTFFMERLLQGAWELDDFQIPKRSSKTNNQTLDIKLIYWCKHSVWQRLRSAREICWNNRTRHIQSLVRNPYGKREETR